MTLRLSLLLLFAVVFAAPAACAKDKKAAEPQGYREDAYRAPVPATLRGAIVLDTPAAFALWSGQGAVFIDALPHAPRPAEIPANAVWREKPRLDIPGSLWLPDTGFGQLSPETTRYFESGLVKATGGDRSRPLAFYCQENCWMSWNAAKRALSLGYAKIYWYPAGTDGWAAAGHPLEERRPEPRE